MYHVLSHGPARPKTFLVHRLSRYVANVAGNLRHHLPDEPLHSNPYTPTPKRGRKNSFTNFQMNEASVRRLFQDTFTLTDKELIKLPGLLPTN